MHLARSLRTLARHGFLASTLACAVGATGCADADPPSSSEDVTEAAPRVCAAVRGNGDRVPAHFGALARIHEHYGLLWGISGGSSGSVTSFLVESIYANPLLVDCGSDLCSDAETGARAALLLKSFQGYLEVLADTEEGQAFSAAAVVAKQLQAKNVEALLDGGSMEGVEALKTILSSNELRPLVNPALFELLATSSDPVAHAQDLVVGLKAGVAFKLDSERVFLRPGVLSFEGLADKLGRVAAFYAGDGEAFDEAGMRAFFEGCATPGRGLDWSEVSTLPLDGTTCGKRFGELLSSYRKEVAATGLATSRVDAPLGRELHVLVSTSVIEGPTATMWSEAKAAYEANTPIVWAPSFDDVRIGYFGADGDLDRLLENPGRFDDLKTKKTRAIRNATWRTALSTSPAEPGLAAGVPLEDGSISVGGWPDLQPVQALRNLGCDEIVYVTRRGNMIGSFADQVATELGMNDADRKRLFALGTPESAFAGALSEADAVWCTDWDNAKGIAALVANGYDAPAESRSAFFTDGDDPYGNVQGDLGIQGCSPGVGD